MLLLLIIIRTWLGARLSFQQDVLNAEWYGNELKAWQAAFASNHNTADAGFRWIAGILWTTEEEGGGGRGRGRGASPMNSLLTHGEWVLKGYISRLHWLPHFLRVVLIPQTHIILTSFEISEGWNLYVILSAKKGGRGGGESLITYF